MRRHYRNSTQHRCAPYLLPDIDQPLLVRQEALLVQHLRFRGLDRVGKLHVQRDRLALRARVSLIVQL